MRKKYILREWIKGLSLSVLGIAILTLGLITGDPIAIGMVCLAGFITAMCGVIIIQEGYSLRNYNNYLSERTRKETLNKLLRESNVEMENNLNRLNNEPKQH